jgi:hypothetical protein
MKIPSKCPHCGNPMLTEYIGQYDAFTVKTCSKSIDHWIRFLGKTNLDEVEKISVRLSPGLECAIWDLVVQTIEVIHVDKTTYIPFFKPDLSNCKTLVHKIKTYVVFS